MTRAIVSRCRIFELKPLSEEDIIKGLKRAAEDKTDGLGKMGLKVEDGAYRHFSWAANGDLRNALNGLELAALSTPVSGGGKIVITKEIAAQSVQTKNISVDESMYYNMLSAFCKSLRGTDPDAALYWAFRLIEAGCDPLLILRRLLAHSSEDVGMADPNALTVAVSAYQAYERMGITEGSLPLAQAIIYVASAPKSNSVLKARNRATEAAAKAGGDVVPFYLRDRSYPSPLDDNSKYFYPHDYGGYFPQRYLPDSLKDEVFYEPTESGYEKKVGEFLEFAKKEAEKAAKQRG